MAVTDYDSIGDEKLRDITGELVSRFADDFIIGFLFLDRNLENIARREYQLAAVHLGGPVKYEGRPLPRVHRPLQINKGQFRRRLAIVRTVLAEFEVDPAIIERWVAYEASLEKSIVNGDDCIPE